MAFSISNLVRVGEAMGHVVWHFLSTAETMASIQGANYFNPAANLLAEDDWILAIGTDGAAPLVVASNLGGTVVVSAAIAGAAVSAALLNIAAVTVATVAAGDALSARDLVLFHSITAGAPRVDYADHFNPWLRAALRSGRYYGGKVSNPGVTTTFTVTANVHYALPFILDKRTQFQALAAAVTTLHASNFRLGLYAHENGLPGSLILDAGEVSAGSTGVKDFAASLTLDPGIYWLTSVYAGTPTMRAAGFHTAAANTPELAQLLGIGTPGTFDTRVSNALTYGALPATFGAVSYAAGESPGHWLKAS